MDGTNFHRQREAVQGSSEEVPENVQWRTNVSQ
jgi:hypothetical protein